MDGPADLSAQTAAASPNPPSLAPEYPRRAQGVGTFDPPNERRSYPNISLAAAMDDEDLLRAHEAVRNLERFFDRRAMNSVFRNRQTLEELLAAITEKAAKHGRAADWSRAHIDVETALVNWLQSTRTYVDQTRAYLSRTFGNDSDELRDFVNATHREFDDHFTYRFTYGLRDFVTHKSMPPFELTMHGYAREPEAETEIRIRFRFDPAALLAEWDGWHSLTKASLGELQGPFMALPVIQDATECLLRIDEVVVGADLSRAKDDALLVLSLADRVADKEGVPILVGVDVRTKDDVGIEHKAVPVEMATFLLETLSNEE